MRKYVAGVAVVAMSAVGGLLVSTSAGATRPGKQEFVVLYAKGASARPRTPRSPPPAARSSRRTPRSASPPSGAATATSSPTRQPPAAIEGAARNQFIGSAPDRLGADGQVKKFDPAQADLEGRRVSRLGRRCRPAGRSRSPVCSGT